MHNASHLYFSMNLLTPLKRQSIGTPRTLSSADQSMQTLLYDNDIGNTVKQGKSIGGTLCHPNQFICETFRFFYSCNIIVIQLTSQKTLLIIYGHCFQST